MKANVSLKRLPRVGVQQEVVNLHYSTANVNHYMDTSACDRDNIMIDAKDAKAIVCGDTEPLLHPGKFSQDKVYWDHSWNKSKVEMTHTSIM